MGWCVTVRAARPEDGAARRRLVRDGFRDHHWDAFLLFLFQEVTLQAALLAGAVLFIFCGVPAPACACALPAAAALVALGVRAAHAAAARRHALNIDKEMMGFVAEVCAPPPAAPAPAPAPSPAGLLPPHLTDEPYHKQVVGTVSVSEYWGPGHSGWLHALAVHPGWRRRGAGAALAGAARRAGAAAGLDTLEAVTSELQAAARSVLHAAGWSCRGSYRRPVLGRALGLRVAQLCVEPCVSMVVSTYRWSCRGSYRRPVLGRALGLRVAQLCVEPCVSMVVSTYRWSCRGSYRRPVLGRALGLRVAQLCVELPHA